MFYLIVIIAPTVIDIIKGSQLWNGSSSKVGHISDIWICKKTLLQYDKT